MVNFSETLESQLVPEWKHAFCDYNQLKQDLDNIKTQSHRFSLLSDGTRSPNQSIKPPSFRQLGSLARRMSGRLRNAAVKVHLRHRTADDPDEELYETELLVDNHCEIDNEKIFFARLDGQLNKVNQFFRKKEQEFYEKAEEIKVQLEKLIAARNSLKEQQDLSVSDSSHEKGSDHSKSDMVMVNVELGSILEQDESLEGSTGQRNMCAPSPARDFGLAVPQATPSLLFGALKQKVMDDISNHSRQSTASDIVLGNNFTKFDRKRVQYAEKTLQDACMELYRGLEYLRGFSSLNLTAFSKILKKYDKKTGRDASVVYMKVVENAYFHSSDKALKMMIGLEKKFTEVFTTGNHKKAMNLLRPVRKTASHIVTFFLGVFTGCSIACLVAFFALLDFKWIRSTDDSPEFTHAMELYLEAIYPLFSILAMVLLHLCLFGWNLYSWRKKQINYAFIFGLPPGTEIKYRELLLLAMGLATLVTAALLGHFMIYTNMTSSLQTAILPFLILAVYMFRNAEYVLCYSIFGHFKEKNIGLCNSDNLHFAIITYVVSMVPYWWRFIQQCVRRWFDERKSEHIKNGLKYFSAMLAAGISLTYKSSQTTTWLAIFIVVSTLVAAYQLYWDLYKDWGLLRTDSKNYLLRDELALKNKSLYYASMVLNTILRFAWLQSVTRIEPFGSSRRYFTDWFFASLEVVRRVHWNFYRLENEHLNNVGNFRATKAIPLPFVDVDDDD
ncbi:hypothetical protein L7F22_000789 [Adiantum nelumboides]|nr:hypothetical protein [Adiantum nelumboides]